MPDMLYRITSPAFTDVQKHDAAVCILADFARHEPVTAEALRVAVDYLEENGGY